MTEAHRSRDLLVNPTAVRIYLISLGVFAVLWAGQIFPTAWREPTLDRIASRIIEGQIFKVEDLGRFLPLIEQVETSAVCRPASVRSSAVIRLRVVENASKAGQPNVNQLIDELLVSVRDALRCSPADSFLWLVLYWAETTRHGFEAHDLDYVRLSYEVGPYEGWVALKRNPIALMLFEKMSPALRERVVSEFVGLVNSGFHREAAEILVGPGWRLRDELLPRLAVVPQTHRVAFDREVFELGYDVNVPGVVHPVDPPWRRR